MKTTKIDATGRLSAGEIYEAMAGLSQKALADIARKHGQPVRKYKGQQLASLADFFASNSTNITLAITTK